MNYPTNPIVDHMSPTTIMWTNDATIEVVRDPWPQSFTQTLVGPATQIRIRDQIPPRAQQTILKLHLQPGVVVHQHTRHWYGSRLPIMLGIWWFAATN